MRATTLTRRQALRRVASIPAQVPAGREATPVRLAPRDQLVNTLEYQEQAKRTLTREALWVRAVRAS